MRWMEIAWADVGVHEIAGEAAEGKILSYFRNAGGAAIASDEVPWCAAFAGACLSGAGIALDAISKGERYLARSYLKIGTQIDMPRVGALCILTRPGGGAGAGHVGFVAGWTDTHVQVLGGNQADAVNVTAFPRDRIVGLRWPEAAVTASALASDGSRIAAAALRQQADAAKTGLSQATQLTPPNLDGLAQSASNLEGAVGTLTKFAAFSAKQWPVIVALLGGYWLARMLYDAWVIKRAREDDANTGAHTGRAVSNQEAATDAFPV